MESSPDGFYSSTAGVYSQQSHDDNFTSSFVSSSHYNSFPSTSSLALSTSSAPSVTCSGFQFFLNTVFLGILCIVGFVGNTTSFLVFQRDRHNRVPVFLLQSLSVADNSVLCTAFIALSVFYGLAPVFGREAMERASPYIRRYMNPIACVAQSCTIWMTVLLAINRYLAVCRPFTSRRWLTMKHARIQVFVVVFFSALFNIPRVFETDIYSYAANSSSHAPSSPTTSPSSPSTSPSSSSRSPAATVTSLPEAYWYFEVVYMNAFYTSVILVLPILLLIGFNIPLVHQLQRSKRQMIQNSLSYSGQQENNITVVMVIIILEMIICHSPDRVVQVIDIFAIEDSQRACPAALYYVTNIANTLVILNSSTDFIVYYVFRTRFRTILYDQVLCRRPRSDSRSFVGAWNSRTDLVGPNHLFLHNTNGEGLQGGVCCPVQRIEENDQDRTAALPASPEDDDQTTSLVRKNDLLPQTTEPNHLLDATSVVF